MPDPLGPLSRSALFRNCTPEQLATFFNAGTSRFTEQDGFFFQQGDPASHLFVLIEGRGRLTQVSVDGQEVVLRILVPGQMFGAIGLADPDSNYPASAQAMEDSIAMAWDVIIFRRLCGEIPNMSFNMMSLMTAYIQEMQDRFRELATERVEQRVARTLLRLTAQTGRKVDEGVLVDMTLTRQNLAEMTGTTLYTVSRMLSEWERQGLIQTGRGRVIITDPHGLVRIAEDLTS